MLQLSNQARPAIVAMAKALPKASARSYATVIGIRNGKACITDGFGLLAYKIPGESPIDATVTRDLFPSEVKFPQWEMLMPTTGQKVSVEALEDFLDLVNAMGTKQVKDVYIALAGDKAWAFKSRPNPNNTDATAFNPWIAKTFLKALPKGIKVTSGLIDDGKLMINFEGYSLLLMAVLINQK